MFYNESYKMRRKADYLKPYLNILRINKKIILLIYCKIDYERITGKLNHIKSSLFLRTNKSINVLR